MPNRIIRDWTDSERVNKLTVHAERFYLRLLMKVDDYGNYPNNDKIIRAALYPLLLDEVRESDIQRFLLECKEAGLVRFYSAEGKNYLHVWNFRQRLDRAKPKYPKPPPDNESLSNDNDLRAEVESEVEVETETRRESSARTREEIFKIFQKEFREHWPNEAARFDRESESGTAKEILVAKRDKIISDALKNFWNNYEETGWKTRNNVPVVDRVASFRKWITREKQFTKS